MNYLISFILASILMVSIFILRIYDNLYTIKYGGASNWVSVLMVI